MNDFNISVSPKVKRSDSSSRTRLGGATRRKPDLADLTRSLNEIHDSSGGGANEVLPLVYDELRRHAGHRMNGEYRQHTLQPTALVHEAWLRLIGNGKRSTKWDNRAHFFGAAARAMRRILIENIRRKTAIKRGGDWIRVDIEKIDLAVSSPEEKVLLIDEALEELQVANPEKARVVMLKFFGGHSNAEVAGMLDLSERTVERHWAYAKAWLFQRISEQQDCA